LRKKQTTGKALQNPLRQANLPRVIPQKHKKRNLAEAAISILQYGSRVHPRKPLNRKYGIQQKSAMI
jgi:hypothetical protein